uniref:Putative mariner mos1 transposase n=1 Tax=Ixodes ricinus TaxID=34613 RepID=A0A6B0UMT2_IXORI
MVVPLLTFTDSDQRSVMRFLSCEVVEPAGIYGRMRTQYGDLCVPLQQVYEWTRKGQGGFAFVEDALRPGQGHCVVTNENIASVEALVRKNKRITVVEIAIISNVSVGSAHNMSMMAQRG